MPLALLDILTGNFADGTAVSKVDTQDQLYYSIQSHLCRLLNSRQGSLNHLPDYGLPDITEIYRSLPYSMTTLVKAIEYAINTYEPRLNDVSITQHSFDETECVLHLRIAGNYQDGSQLTFDTYFTRGGQALMR